jgi:hypothetical protein
MGEVEQASRKIASGKAGAATERLRQLLSTIHRMNSDRYVADAKMHDMVAVAMEEDWDGSKAGTSHAVPHGLHWRNVGP